MLFYVGCGMLGLGLIGFGALCATFKSVWLKKPSPIQKYCDRECREDMEDDIKTSDVKAKASRGTKYNYIWDK